MCYNYFHIHRANLLLNGRVVPSRQFPQRYFNGQRNGSCSDDNPDTQIENENSERAYADLPKFVEIVDS